MASETINQLHLLLIPLLAPGHTIPMIEMAKLLAQRENVKVTIVTTPVNAIRYGPTLQQHINSGLPVCFLELPLAGVENGLPEGCESADALPGLHLLPNFSVAVDMLQHRLEERFETLTPRPSCILSDKYMLWSADTAAKYKIPRIVFDGMSCFKQLCTHHLYASNVYNEVPESQPFVLPGLPDRIEITKAQLPLEFNHSPIASSEHLKRVRETESKAYGMVINSFEELEQEYVKEFKKIKGGKVWCIGPLSLSSSNDSSISVDDQRALTWLDSKEPGSVVYASFGSSSQVIPPQLIELGLALEASKSPFIWVIRAGEKAQEVEKWLLESQFEDRVKDRGLIIRDWAPQVLILSHPSVGGFLTHCGWNSVLESVSAGVPMITWPMFAEQFLNEKLVVQVLGVGVGVGARVVVHWGEEEKFGVTVKSEDVKDAIEKVMDIGIEGNERRKKAKVLGRVAKKATEEGGSSHCNLTLLIQDLRELEEVKTQEPMS
ncbi:UDP-glucuronosyl/UDP-glucosyltransferase [Artemisia annua]|uniref:Glycosyltransferase n=1 Tax=Artemisia annua TaxID=35608 RepID=A0A2U1MGX3_ARTAN|nr:UDP-glucuronosyl/UDP-glucosyltransferase [Artemisia annua]